MTDTPDRRLDLRALDAAEDPARTDAVIAAAMARINAVGRPPVTPSADVIPSVARDLQLLTRYQRRLLAAAAVLAAIATAAIATSPRRDAEATDVLADWATSSHVPTNGELLAAFHGYRP